MANEAKKISQLNEITSATADDFVVLVNDPSGVPSTRKMTVGNLFGNSTVNVSITSISPANSTATAIKAGKIFYDSNYLYVVVEENIIKRVALSLF